MPHLSCHEQRVLEKRQHAPSMQVVSFIFQDGTSIACLTAGVNSSDGDALTHALCCFLRSTVSTEQALRLTLSAVDRKT